MGVFELPSKVAGGTAAWKDFSVYVPPEVAQMTYIALFGLIAAVTLAPALGRLGRAAWTRCVTAPRVSRRQKEREARRRRREEEKREVEREARRNDCRDCLLAILPNEEPRVTLEALLLGPMPLSDHFMEPLRLSGAVKIVKGIRRQRLGESVSVYKVNPETEDIVRELVEGFNQTAEELDD